MREEEYDNGLKDGMHTEYDETGKPYFVCRKVLIGNGQCFQRIEVFFKFNELRGLLDRQIGQDHRYRFIAALASGQ